MVEVARRGFFPGIVVSADDPEKRGRLQVRVPAIYGGDDEDEKIEDDELPWALPAFPSASSDGTGMAWVPTVGAGVWVGFMGGDWEDPVYVGGWYTEGDVPGLFASSYEGGKPKTLLVTTENGHVYEMRWKGGESEVRWETEKGLKLRLIDDPALGGLKIEMTTPMGFQLYLDEPNLVAAVQTPALREMRLDDQAQSAHIVTPTQRVELLDIPQKINATTPGEINATAGTNINALAGANIAALAGANISATAGGTATITAGGAATITAGGAAAITAQGLSLTSTGSAPTVQTGGGTLASTFTGAALYTFLGALTYVISGLYALTALGLTLTAATVAITTTGLPILLGSVAVLKYRLVTERMFIAFNKHKHSGVTAGGDLTGPPDIGSGHQFQTPNTTDPDFDILNNVTAFVKAD